MARQTVTAVDVWLQRILAGILLGVLGLIVVHAPLTVFLGVQFPAYEGLIKGWKEGLLLLALVPAAMLAVRRKKETAELLRDPLLLLILAYTLLHLALAAIFRLPLDQTVAGLAIDLRYLLFFVLVYSLMRIYPGFRRPALITGAVGAVVVLLFGVLQIFVLPKDVLAGIGYGPSTIEPYLTIDRNDDYVRINSTLRGPNPLGAYVLIVASVAAAYLLRHPSLRRTPAVVTAGVVAALSPAVLWASYSRSALVAACVALAGVIALRFRSRLRLMPIVLVAAATATVVGSALFAFRDTSFVQHVILHRDPLESNQINSNEDHLASLIDGAQRMAVQPLGAGVGSTGSASLLGEQPLIIENQYFFIAHEAGWLGLILFLLIFGLILRRLWQRRDDWLANAVLASGVGLALIGILLPVWVDDTVSIIWWGLAAVALMTPRQKKPRRVLS